VDWDPFEVAFDGMFCDAVGQATDGYFCAPRRVIGVGGPEPGLSRDARDKQDIADILGVLFDRWII